MDERLRLIARLLEGVKTAPLCREFGISRVTDHKAQGTTLVGAQDPNGLWYADYKGEFMFGLSKLLVWWLCRGSPQI